MGTKFRHEICKTNKGGWAKHSYAEKNCLFSTELSVIPEEYSKSILNINKLRKITECVTPARVCLEIVIVTLLRRFFRVLTVVSNSGLLRVTKINMPTMGPSTLLFVPMDIFTGDTLFAENLATLRVVDRFDYSV